MRIGRVLGTVVVVLVIIPVVAAVATFRLRHHSPASPAAQSPQHGAVTPAACTKPAHLRQPLIGVAIGPPWGGNLTKFIQATGVHPQIVAQYLQFGDPFNAAVACRVARSGGELLVQWDPTHVPISKIAKGGMDQYITRFAGNVRATRLPIVLSFGHEMNGNWYPWGYTHVSPSQFIAAWRHIHQLFAKAGAGNVTWLWDVNHWDLSLAGHAASYGISPAREWWPGARYVDWAGLDAYYETPSATFHNLFKSSLKAVHRITHKPVLIAETAAAAGPSQPLQIHTLFTGIKRSKVVGAIWFDANGREEWRLEGHPAGIAAFRTGARTLSRNHH